MKQTITKGIVILIIIIALIFGILYTYERITRKIEQNRTDLIIDDFTEIMKKQHAEIIQLKKDNIQYTPNDLDKKSFIELKELYLAKQEDYNHLLKEYESTLDNFETVLKQLDKTNEALKKSKRKVGISGIASAGIDQELNFNASEGFIVKGMLLNRVSVGGGLSCTQRFVNDKTIVGGQINFEITIYF